MKGKLLYEGKAKKIYECGTSSVILEFKDDATAGNKAKHDVFAGKGKLNCDISSMLMKYLEYYGIDTHFIDKISDNKQICRRISIIPIEVIVRNTTAGTFCKRYNVKQGVDLDDPIVEFCVKDDDLNDPLINNDAIIALKMSTPDQVKKLRETAKVINIHLKSLFKDLGLKLVDFKLEFGTETNYDSQHCNEIVLADEICPDTMRLWNKNNESFDKDLFRNNSGDLITGYQYVADKLHKEFANEN